MNKVFDIKRFGNVLLYDLRRVQGNYLISGLILGVLPAVFFAFTMAFSFIFTGEPTKMFSYGTIVPVAIGAMIGLLVTFPSKVYGEITDNRYGSGYLMLPASTFEKTLSIIAVTCVVAPVFIIGLFLFSDWIMSLCFGTWYGDSIIGYYAQFRRALAEETSGVLNLRLGGILYVDVCESMLAFTLGAIYFKKSKAAKTILCLMLASSIVTTALLAIVGCYHAGISDFIENVFRHDPATVIDSVSLWTNVAMNIWYIFLFALLTGGIYLRLKTMKH